jgi:hypothetical protein
VCQRKAPTKRTMTKKATPHEHAHQSALHCGCLTMRLRVFEGFFSEEQAWTTPYRVKHSVFV